MNEITKHDLVETALYIVAVQCILTIILHLLIQDARDTIIRKLKDK